MGQGAMLQIMYCIGRPARGLAGHRAYAAGALAARRDGRIFVLPERN